MQFLSLYFNQISTTINLVHISRFVHLYVVDNAILILSLIRLAIAQVGSLKFGGEWKFKMDIWKGLCFDLLSLT